MSDWRRLSANYLYNILGVLLPTITSLATVPFYIHQIGSARYGVVVITWVLLGYFGFLDFGLSRATANALARLGHASSRERSPILVTAFCCNLCLGLTGGLIMYLVGHLVLLHLVKVPGSLVPETLAAFPWMAAMLPLGMLAGVSNGALESRERFLVTNPLGSIGTMLGQVAPLLCTYVFGPSLTVVIPATLLARLLMVSLAYGIVIQIERPVRLLDFDLRVVRRLFRYGSWVSISSLLNPLLDTSAQMVIGIMLGTTAVTTYSVPMTLATRSQVFATAMARTLFPRVSRLSHDEAVATTRRATLMLAYGFGAICAPAILFSGPFLRLWIGPNFQAASQSIAQVVMFGAWTNGLAFLPYAFLQAQGRPHVTAAATMIEIVPFFAVLWLLLTVFGLPGAAVAWTLRVGVNCVALQLISGCISRQAWSLLPALVLMLCSLLVARLVPMTTLVAATAAGLIALVFVVLASLIDPAIRNVAHRVVSRVGLPPAYRVRDPG